MATKLTVGQVERFRGDVDTAVAGVSQVLARWHDAGQSHWQGGDHETSTWDNPPERVAEAFKLLRAAEDALIKASHELMMRQLELPQED